MLTLFYDCAYDVTQHMLSPASAEHGSSKFVLWRYVAVQIWRVKELFVLGIVASTIKEVMLFACGRMHRLCHIPLDSWMLVHVIYVLYIALEEDATCIILHFIHIKTQNLIREKGRDLTQSFGKSPYTNREIQKASWQHKNRHKKNSITQRLWTDSGRSVGVTSVNPTGVVKPVYERSTFPPTATVV